jgi:glutamate synthase (NADPH/NADH) small chain
MGYFTGFKEVQRQTPQNESVRGRLSHFGEFDLPFGTDMPQKQASRCMDCGVPFCHNGCPLGNLIPDFNEAVYSGDWKSAYTLLSQTNNFPEFTGRICPAPCEASCVLNINADPVTIEFVEKSIIEHAFEQGWVQPVKDIKRNGIKVAIIGSGPAGLACADQLNKLGYSVDLYERSDRIGGLLRYGIPDFKLEKDIIDRRLKVMKNSGIRMHTSVNVGVDISAKDLLNRYDRIVLSGGSTVPRDLPIKGRDLNGIHFAMDFLEQNNRKVAGLEQSILPQIDVKGKHVLVIGGGDTGADCVGTSNRLNAASVTQIELLAKPSHTRSLTDLWPNWPMVLRTSSSHEEGCDREWAILTSRFYSKDGINVSGVELVNVEWTAGPEGNNQMVPIEESRRTLICDHVFLAIGFSNPQKKGLLDQLGVKLDERGNVHYDDYKTSRDKVYVAGDMRRGQSLVVWAIAEGRSAAEVLHHDSQK